MNENNTSLIASWSTAIMASSRGDGSDCVIKPISSISISCEMPSPPVEGQTHWVIPGRILMGRSPSQMADQDLFSIISSGVDTFVNLQQNYNEYGNFLGRGESADYRIRFQNMAESRCWQIQDFPPHKIDFLYFPVPDYGTMPDKILCAFIDQLRHLLGII